MWTFDSFEFAESENL